jgi:hypothetical protein
VSDQTRDDTYRQFVHDAIERSGYVSPGGAGRPLDDSAPDDDDDAPGEYEYESEQDEAQEEVTDDAAALVSREALAAWVRTLNGADRERANRDSNFAAAGFEAYLNRVTDPETAAKLFNGWLATGPDEGEATEQESADPGTATVEWALGEGRADLEAAGYDPAAWLEQWSTASPQAWADELARVGWDSSIGQPSYSRLPEELQVEHHRQYFAQLVADVKAGRRRPV